MSIETGKGSSDSDIKEDFFRQFKQEETSLQEQMTRLKGTALQAAERASIVDQCLASISRLSNEVKDASTYLPAYDQRIYSTAVRSLIENLQEIRNASAPKRKFAFKKSIAQRDVANPGHGPSEGVSVQSQTAIGDSSVNPASSSESEHHNIDPNENQGILDAEPVSGAEGSLTISSLSSTHHKLNSTSLKPNSSISITQIHHSAVDFSASLSNPFATLTINTVTESLLLCGRTSGAAHITLVRNSTLIIRSRQVRMHECADCLVYLRCGSRPIIEGCRGIRFTPLLPPVSFDTAASPRPDSPNMWDQVDDFGWLRAEHSPNWSALQPGDEGTIESGPWEAIKLFGGTGGSLSGLDDLLRAAKVI